MTSLVSAATFKVVTRDPNVSPAGTDSFGAGFGPSFNGTDQELAAALDVAQHMIEERLGRKLEHGTYTETLAPSADGYLYPSMTPLDVQPYRVNTVAMRPHGLFDTFGYQVTYTGGWTAQTLPAALVRAICLLVQANNDPVIGSADGGAAVTSIGDLSLSTSGRISNASTDPVWPSGLWTLIAQYRPLGLRFS